MSTSSSRDDYYADVEVVFEESDQNICRSLKVDGVEIASKVHFIPGVPLLEVAASDDDPDLQLRKLNVAFCIKRLTVATIKGEAK